MKKALGRMAAKNERLANPAFLRDVGDVQRHEVRAAQQVAELDEPRPGGRFLLGVARLRLV